MNLIVFTLFSFVCINICSGETSLYGYYTGGGIHSGLKADSHDFVLNGKKLTILSGSLHYFRLPWQSWKQRIEQFKAAGLNTVETYVAWNVHEPEPGHFNFDNDVGNLREFIKHIKEADMFMLIRIGPFIAGEWEMGGFPPWLLRDEKMQFRTNYKPYLNAVERYYKKVLAEINDLQFTKGGPIIALQFENEFGDINNDAGREYFNFLKNIIDNSGFNQLLINCDCCSDVTKTAQHTQKGVLLTWNFNRGSLGHLDALRRAQPNKPLLVTEFWPGWMDKWGEKTHHTYNVRDFDKEVSDVIFVANSSINFYMFFGGTNFGFMNGDELTTSYDYNAPISESGQYTDKFYKTRELITKFNKQRNYDFHIPAPPPPQSAAKYGVVKIHDYLSLDDVSTQLKPLISEVPRAQEFLNMGPDHGQNYGFTLYRKKNVQKFKHLELWWIQGHAVVVLDDKQVGTTGSISTYRTDVNNGDFTRNQNTLDVLVENTGRGWFGPRMGMNGDVLVDGQKVHNFEIYPLEFKPDFVEKLKSLKGRPLQNIKSPGLFRAELDIQGQPKDTFLRFDGWVKGVAFVNGINIGRYYNVGPQKTLYIPNHWLKTGKNDIYLFELHQHSDSIELVDKPDLGRT